MSSSSSSQAAVGELVVGDEVLGETILYLESCLPCEGVGLWSGRGSLVTRFTQLANASQTPLTRYAVHPQDWISALAAAHQNGEEPLALVHSHPTAAATPSGEDVRNWFYPDLWCVIVSFQANPPLWRAYRI